MNLSLLLYIFLAETFFMLRFCIEVVALDSNHQKSNVSLALCLITKNDHDDLNEWITYHKSIGVNNVIIFDDHSDYPQYEVIKEHILSGFVVYYGYTKTLLFQPPDGNHLFVYKFCLDHFKYQYTHIGLIDSDEFIVVVNKSRTVLNVLEQYKQYGGLTLNWKLFGSSGHLIRPTGGVLANYHECFENFHVKSIVKASAVSQVISTHYCNYHEPYYAVDTNFKPAAGPFNPTGSKGAFTHPKVPLNASSSLYDVMYLNHYNTKSLEDFKLKHARGSADKKAKPKDFDYFVQFHKHPLHECGYLQPHKKQ